MTPLVAILATLACLLSFGALAFVVAWVFIVRVVVALARAITFKRPTPKPQPVYGFPELNFLRSYRR